MGSKRSHEGYLLIDNGMGPGVTSAFVRASGKDIPVVGAGQRYETATVTCCHCGTVVMLRPDRSRPRGYCRKCDHYVCDEPACNAECRPFMGLLEALQDQAYHLEVRGLSLTDSGLLVPRS